MVAVEEAKATEESVDALTRVVAHGPELAWCWEGEGPGEALGRWAWEGEGCWEEGCEGDEGCLDSVHFGIFMLS